MVPEPSPREVVVLIGLPASGKSTFYQSRFASTHQHISKDHFPNAKRRDARQARLIDEALRDGRSIVVDNTSPSATDRSPIIAQAKQHGARVIGYYFATPLTDSIARNAAREGRARVPERGILSIAKRLEHPSLAEGFDALFAVRLIDGQFQIEPWKEQTP
jgi:predicted kinase